MLPLNLFNSVNKLVLFFRPLTKGFNRSPGILPVTEMVNHMFIFLRFHYIICHFTPPYLKFCSIEDTHLKFTDRLVIFFGFITIGYSQFLSRSGMKMQQCICHVELLSLTLIKS